MKTRNLNVIGKTFKVNENDLSNLIAVYERWAGESFFEGNIDIDVDKLIEFLKDTKPDIHEIVMNRRDMYAYDGVYEDVLEIESAIYGHYEEEMGFDSDKATEMARLPIASFMLKDDETFKGLNKFLGEDLLELDEECGLNTNTLGMGIYTYLGSKEVLDKGDCDCDCRVEIKRYLDFAGRDISRKDVTCLLAIYSQVTGISPFSEFTKVDEENVLNFFSVSAPELYEFLTESAEVDDYKDRIDLLESGIIDYSENNENLGVDPTLWYIASYIISSEDTFGKFNESITKFTEENEEYENSCKSYLA